jgi:hypothetical protein
MGNQPISQVPPLPGLKREYLSESQELIWPAIILLTAIILRFYDLGEESLWRDEVFSIQDAVSGKGLPPQNLIRPLYYILLRGWMFLGDSDTWLRSLSVIFGIVVVILTYQFGKSLFNYRVARVAASLMAVSPLAINHSQEVRMYMLSVGLGIGGSLALYFATISPKPNKAAYLYWGVLRLLAILSTPVNLLMLVADIVLLLVQQTFVKTSFRYLRYVLLAICLLSFPTLVTVFRVLPAFLGERSGSNTPGLRALIGALTQFTVWPTEIELTHLGSIFGHIINVYALITLGLLAIALIYGRRNSPLWLTASWAFIPVLLMLGLAQFSSGVWYGEGTIRYILMSMPYVMVLMAVGFVRLWDHLRPAALVVATVYAIAISLALANYYTVQQRPDWRGIAQAIETQASSNDAIVMVLGTSRRALQYYYSGELPIYQEIQDGSTNDLATFEQGLDDLPDEYNNLFLVVRYKDYKYGIGLEQREMFIEVLENSFIVNYEQDFGLRMYLLKVEHKANQES